MFFATQCDSSRLMTEDQHREFDEAFDCIIFDAARDAVDIITMQAHGEGFMLNLVASYPVDAINCHDRLPDPSLAEAWRRFCSMVVGMITEWTMLLEGPAEAIEAEIQDAGAQPGGRGHMVAPTCMIPTNVPHERVRAACDEALAPASMSRAGSVGFTDAGGIGCTPPVDR
jgi:uroporphyrinogen decarboxylase